ncbi:MAG TPA: hydantoinase/oxoprolinase family protein [Roseiflexaceae bacterium]|nr:hydantoinase/oxoprolinase family protein [Roseiflexaceae bacterium]
MDILGVDIGGTFTDFVLLRDGRLTVHKLLSTPDDPARALLAGVAMLGAPGALVHGTTVATNALLERRGARVALITTAGFRDVLALGRGDRPSLYDLDAVRPEPLVPEQLRLEAAERLDHTGAVLSPLDPAECARLAALIAALPIEAVAICLLHSYANPAHEQLLLDALAADNSTLNTQNSQLFVSASHKVLPEPREYERTSTTVVNAYVAPALGRYLARLEEALLGQGVRALRLMASDGGSMGLATAHELAARATLSGPAGGVVGARAVAERAGFARIITFDMGGTSTDVALCDGALPLTGESRVGGLPVRLPSMDIHTVGAGGGSLARLDAGGALRVGPESAGADPGPACYGKGSLPTVTDANLLLGRLQPDAFLGGRMALDVERARSAFAPLAERLAERLEARGLRLVESEPSQATGDESGIPSPQPLAPSPQSQASDLAALGVLRVANAAMERAIRAISVERGYDPREFTLVAFGGAGPLHAAHLAEALGMRRVLVPRFPGVLSALGMLAADVTRDASRALLAPLDALDPAALRAGMRDLGEAGLAALAADGEPPERCRVEWALDLRYAGQGYELTVPWPEAAALAEGDSSDLAPHAAALAGRFHALHERRYGHAMPGRAIEAVLLRMRAVSARPPLHLAPADEATPRVGPLVPAATVSAALSAEHAGRASAPVYPRADTRPGDRIPGPAIVTQLDATTVVPPGWEAEVDTWANLVLVRNPSL